ncbi:MAG: ABC-2 type transport system ATP-binding protein [Gammaproteobacteria bacterium]|jgi:ABC-2 type transport system ATP-binding protein
MPKPLIQVDKLSRYFDTRCAVKELSFELEAGEVLGFLGPNGAGKTTTMQMITGNLIASAGQITINGFDIIEAPLQARQQIGYLPETPPLYQEDTVQKFLIFCARLHGIKSPDINKAVSTALDQCGLNSVANRLIKNLSKGYRQRIGIAQAIIHDPPVVILDEPTVGLDPIQIREIRALIKSLGESRSVILSSHILPEVQATCDRVIIIRQGELVYQSSIEALEQQRHKIITVAFENPPPLSTFTEMTDVVSAELIDEYRYKIYFEQSSPAKAIVEQSVVKKWGLYELSPDQTSLEDLFIEITQQDNHEHPLEICE